MARAMARKHRKPTSRLVIPDSRRSEAIAANPDTAEELAEQQLPPVGRGAARKEALAANPDVASAEAERQLPPTGRGARRAEALGANPDVAAEEAKISMGRQRRRPRE
jgi:hypothetical protein